MGWLMARRRVQGQFKISGSLPRKLSIGEIADKYGLSRGSEDKVKREIIVLLPAWYVKRSASGRFTEADSVSSHRSQKTGGSKESGQSRKSADSPRDRAKKGSGSTLKSSRKTSKQQ